MKTKKYLLSSIGIMVILIVSLSIIFGNNIAHGIETPPEKSYTSYQIQLDDTLWSIANTHKNTDYYTTSEYIEEVKLINNLSSDTIYAGNSIILPIIQ